MDAVSTARIREFNIFLRVTEEGSFAAVATRLNIDPSTVSKIIQRLEIRLNTVLFHRRPRRLTLTPEGEALRGRAQRMMIALEEIVDEIENSANEPAGSIRISCSAAFARHYLVPIMPSFTSRYPKLRIDIIIVVSAPNIIEQQIDISIQGGAASDHQLIARPICSTRWVLCASPEYVVRHGRPEKPEDLADHQCLNFIPGSYRSYWPLSGENKYLAPQGRVSANNGDVLKSLACRSMGIARLADFHVVEDLARGSLVMLLEDFEPSMPEMQFAVYASPKHKNPRIRVFLDYLEREVQTLIPKLGERALPKVPLLASWSRSSGV